MQEEFDEFENVESGQQENVFYGEIEEFEGQSDGLEKISFDQKDFADEDVEFEDVMLNNLALTFIGASEEEENGIFDDVYKLYQKPTWKEIGRASCRERV